MLNNMFGTLGLGLGLGSELVLLSDIGLVLVLLGTLSRYYCAHSITLDPNRSVP